MHQPALPHFVPQVSPGGPSSTSIACSAPHPQVCPGQTTKQQAFMLLPLMQPDEISGGHGLDANHGQAPWETLQGFPHPRRGAVSIVRIRE